MINLLIKPLERVVLRIDSAILEPAIRRVRRLLRVEAVERGLLVLALVAQAEEDVRRPVGGQGGDLDAAEDVRPVRGRAGAHQVEVVGGEGREVGVAEVRDCLEVLLLVFWGGWVAC